MKKSIFRSNLLRMFISPNLYISIFITALIGQIITLPVNSIVYGVQNQVYSVVEGIFLTSTNADIIIILILPIISFSMTYSQDENSKMLNSWTIRCGTVKYAICNSLSSMIGGFCCVFIGMLLHIFLLSLRLPFLTSATGPYCASGSEFIFLAQNGHIILYIFFELSMLAFSGALTGAIATMSGSFFHNKLVIILFPLMLYMLTLRFFNNLPYQLSFLKLDRILSGGKGGIDNPFIDYFVRLLLVILLSIICIIITTFNIKRRQRNE